MSGLPSSPSAGFGGANTLNKPQPAMTRTIQLVVSNVISGATNAALSYTVPVKGKVTSVLWINRNTQGGAQSVNRAELSYAATYAGESNDVQGIVSSCSAVTGSGGAGTSMNTTTFNHVGFAFEINVGDRLYINTSNTSAPTANVWTCILTILA